MDIIFQSGEFFGDQSGLLSKIITPLIALFSATIGALLTNYFIKKREKVKEEQRIIDLRKYLVVTLSYLVEIIAKERDNIKKNIELLSDMDSNNDKFFETDISISINAIKSVQYNDLLKIFISKDQTYENKYNIFLTSCLTLKSVKKSIHQYFSKLNQEHMSIGERRVQCLNQINETIGLLKIKFDSEEEEFYNEIYDFWTELCQKFTDEEKKNIPFHVKNMIMPLHEKLKGYSGHPDIYSLVRNIKTVESLGIGLQKVYARYIIVLNIEDKKLEDVSKVFTDTITILSDNSK